MRLKEGKQILLADDSEFFRIKTSDVLKGAGHHVRIAKDGSEVIKELIENPLDIDLIILDLQMPHIDGFKVLEWMKNNNRVGKPPVIAVTGAYEASKVLDRLRELGATGFVSKGATPEQFLYRVNKILYGERDYQRKNTRIPTNTPVDFSYMDRNYTGFILNISETGVFIYCSESLMPGDLPQLKFSIPGTDRMIEAEGKVIWVNRLTGEEALFNGMGIR